jgi:hypothetical protein
MPIGLREASAGAIDLWQGNRPSEQSRPRMILEQFSIPDIAAQRIHRLVTGYIHHLED